MAEIQPYDLGGSIYRGAQIDSLGDTRTLRDLQVQKAQQEIVNRNALRQDAPAAIGGDKAALGRIAAVDPATAITLQQHLATQEAAKRERTLKELPVISSTLSQVTDQQSYTTAIEGLRSRGFDVGDAPPQYNPQIVSFIVAQGQKVAEPRKMGDTRKYQKGDQEISEEWTGSGWRQLGAGPKFQEDRVLEEVADPKNPGKTVMLPRGQAAGMPGKSGASGPFEGKAMDAQAWNILLDPKADPTNPQYAAAWTHLTTPKQQVTNDPATGQPMVVTIQPQMPPNIRPPVTNAAPAAAPAPAAEAAPPAAAAPPASAPAAAAPAPQAGVSTQPVPGTGPKATVPEAQSKLAGYANRQVEANKIINDLEAKRPNGFDPAGVGGLISKVPIVGNYVASDERQQYNQAAADWIRAKLRLESGAAIGVKEMEDEFATYFPVAGDSKAVLEQKRHARMIATQNMIQESQGAYQKLFPPGAPKPEAPAQNGLPTNAEDLTKLSDDEVLKRLGIRK